MSRIKDSLVGILLALAVCGAVNADLVNAYDYTLTTQSGGMPGNQSDTDDIPSTQFTKGNATLTVLARSALDSASPDLSTESQLTFAVDPNSPSNDLWTGIEAEVRSESIMFDTATIQSGSYGGTSGQLQFHFSVDGTIGTSATSHVGTVAVEEMSASVLLTSTLPGSGEVMKLELDHDAPNIKFLPGGSSFSIGPFGMSTGAIVYPTQWDQNTVGVQFTLHSILRFESGHERFEPFQCGTVVRFLFHRDTRFRVDHG